MNTFAPKHILCPVDFSEQSAAALRVSGMIAKAFASEVLVLHAQRLEAPAYFTVAQTQALETQLRRSVKAATKHTGEFTRKHLPDSVARRVVVVEDDPVSAILKAQRETGAGLIAMGTHGRGGLARVRLGSIAESVLHQAEVPVLTVGPHSKPPAAPDAIRNVLCAVNFGASSGTAVTHAAALAAQTGAGLTVAYIDETLQGEFAQDAAQRLCEFIPSSVRAHCHVKEVVRQGSAAEQIVELAENSHADLLVVGAEPRRRLGSVLLGSTTELVIRSAPCAVLSAIVKK